MANKLLTPLAFDPASVKLILGGYSPYGFAETKITISKSEDNINETWGADGDYSLALNRHTGGTLTFELQNTSPSNDVLTAMAIQAKTTRFVTFPVIMEDPTGLMMISTVGWIKTQPEYTVSKEVGTCSWVLGIGDATLSGSAEVGLLNTIAQATSFSF